MVDYNNALCRVAGYEVVGDDQDLYIVENLDSEEKVVADKKVGDEVKIESDENFNLDDCSVYLRVDQLKSISLVEMCNNINSTFLV